MSSQETYMPGWFSQKAACACCSRRASELSKSCSSWRAANEDISYCFCHSYSHHSASDYSIPSSLSCSNGKLKYGSDYTGCHHPHSFTGSSAFGQGITAVPDISVYYDPTRSCRDKCSWCSIKNRLHSWKYCYGCKKYYLVHRFYSY